MREPQNRSLPPVLAQARRQWMVRSLSPHAVLAIAIGVIGALCHQFSPLPQWVIPASLVAVLLALIGDRQCRPSYREICTKLDARYPLLQDSCHLLQADQHTLGPLAKLQQQRVVEALADLHKTGALQNFCPRPLRTPLLSATGAVIGLLFYAAAGQLSGTSTSHTGGESRVAAPRAQSSAIRDAVTQIQPPAYTGLAPRNSALQVEAVEGSRISWDITLHAPASGLRMLAADETFLFSPVDTLPSRRWQLTRTLSSSDFYQLAILPTTSATQDNSQNLLPDLYNIDITADKAPEFVFDYPQDNVTIVNLQGDSESSLLKASVTVKDDFQVTETDLLLTLASGSGENVRFRNERITLQPERGQDTQKRYRFSIPIERYDIEPGDEIYWYLEARDNRAPRANIQKSQHFILRWPQQEIFGLSDTEGMAIKILPEYFRSQRQLIIDTEALLADKKNISQQEFRKRSESLAYEQNLLRMRYGRFLGEEDSAMEHGGEEKHPAHEEQADGDDHAHGKTNAHEDHGKHAGHGGHGANGEHGETAQQFGDASGVIAAAGHAHDSSDHATLFDPETKELLRSALNAMWSAWRDLSIVEPRASLPQQHNALRYIKKVQQASRIYLQRVGFETPALDETRRLSGEHEQTSPPQVESEQEDSERSRVMALFTRVQKGEAVDEKAVHDLQQLQALRNDDALRITLAKHLRRYRQQRDCRECRQQLSAFLYRLLPAPSARPALPHIRTASGAYSGWLQQTAEGAPQ